MSLLGPYLNRLVLDKVFQITLLSYISRFADLCQLIQLLASGSKAEEWFHLADCNRKYANAKNAC
jgi:hypothetical protein